MNTKLIKKEHIKTISIKDSKRLEYVWFDAEPEVRTFFSLFLKRVAIEEGWSYDDGYDYPSRISTQTLLDRGLVLHENGKEWFTRPSVTVYAKENGYITTYYNDIKDAEDYANGLIELYDLQLIPLKYES